MFDNQQHSVPEGLIKPAASIATGAFLLSPLGIPFFVRGVPRVLLAGVGGFLAGKLAETVAENIGQIIPPREAEDE